MYSTLFLHSRSDLSFSSSFSEMFFHISISLSTCILPVPYPSLLMFWNSLKLIPPNEDLLPFPYHLKPVWILFPIEQATCWRNCVGHSISPRCRSSLKKQNVCIQYRFWRFLWLNFLHENIKYRQCMQLLIEKELYHVFLRDA